MKTLAWRGPTRHVLARVYICKSPQKTPCHGSRQRERRANAGNACGDQTAVRATEFRLPPRSCVSCNPNRGIEYERHRGCSSAQRALHQSQKGHLDPHSQRSAPNHSTTGYVARLLGVIEVQVHANDQGSLGLLQGWPVGRDIDVRADCVPQVSIPTGITPQVHVQPAAPNMATTQIATTVEAPPQPKLALSTQGRSIPFLSNSGNVAWRGAQRRAPTAGNPPHSNRTRLFIGQPSHVAPINPSRNRTLEPHAGFGRSFDPLGRPKSSPLTRAAARRRMRRHAEHATYRSSRPRAGASRRRRRLLVLVSEELDASHIAGVG